MERATVQATSIYEPDPASRPGHSIAHGGAARWRVANRCDASFTPTVRQSLLSDRLERGSVVCVNANTPPTRSSGWPQPNARRSRCSVREENIFDVIDRVLCLPRAPRPRGQSADDHRHSRSGECRGDGGPLALTLGFIVAPSDYGLRRRTCDSQTARHLCRQPETLSMPLASGTVAVIRSRPPALIRPVAGGRIQKSKSRAPKAASAPRTPARAQTFPSKKHGQRMTAR